MCWMCLILCMLYMAILHFCLLWNLYMRNWSCHTPKYFTTSLLATVSWQMLMLVVLILGRSFQEQKIIKSIFDVFIFSLLSFIQMSASHTQLSRSEIALCSRIMSPILKWFLVHGCLQIHADHLLVGCCLVSCWHRLGIVQVPHNLP